MARLSMRCALGVLVLGLLLFSSFHAGAQSSGDAIDLHYEAPPDCPDQGTLLRAIHDRAPHGFLSADDRSFRVRIERGDADYRGRLEIARSGQMLSVREIHDATCSVVTTALAVFVAIALDPTERSEGVEPLSAGTASAPPPPPPKGPPPAAPTPAQQPAGGWYWGSGVNVGSVFHPTPAWGGRVHAELTRIAGGGALLAPELRLSWGWVGFGESPPRGGEATFRFQTARAEACTLLLHAPAVAAACAGFEAGVLSATTRDLPRAGGTKEAWYAPTVILRPGWHVTDWVSLEAELGVLFPLTRASFVLADPERTLYRIPHVALTATAGVRFWAPLP